ncbi:MAG: hypothetical protein RM049_02555, partial [Nostoc sp. DedQUE04]|uniref:hypothetical protein n=1 Tax=Nostoc sp. DedQUE04 TaxID=3075390 RepID=UPI002AD23B86
MLSVGLTTVVYLPENCCNEGEISFPCRVKLQQLFNIDTSTNSHNVSSDIRGFFRNQILVL